MDAAVAPGATRLAGELPGGAVPQRAASGRTGWAARGGGDRRVSARVRAGGVLFRARRVGVARTHGRSELGTPRARGRWVCLRGVEGRRCARRLRRIKPAAVDYDAPVSGEALPGGVVHELPEDL